MIFEQVQFSNLLALRLLLSSHSVAAVALLANSGAVVAARHSHCTIVGCRNAAALLPAITTREIPRQVIDLLCLASAHAAAGCRNVRRRRRNELLCESLSPILTNIICY